MSQKDYRIPGKLLEHLESLRKLHLDSPRLGNTYLEDTALREYTEHILGGNVVFVAELTRLGDRFSNEYLEASRDAEENEPKLQQFDSYGRRIDRLKLSEGWKLHKKFAAEDGIVALAYEEDRFKLKEWQRFGQLVVLYMYNPSSGLFGCPLAMTDGAAYTLRHILQSANGGGKNRVLLSEAFAHLISRESAEAWTSGQWMTEKKGGSDVSNTETVAVFDNELGQHRLFGYKWFTSATDSQMSLALAKILPEGVEPTVDNLKKIKVSLFFVKMRDSDGNLNNMEIIRLKDKLGTRQLPTAELLLKGTTATLISEPGEGVKMISKMLTMTRIYNSSTAVGNIRRGLALSRDYASRRIIGKVPLSEMPLQLRVLSRLEVIHRGNLMLFLRMSELFSKEHHKIISPHEENILRVMVPLMKLFTAKEALVVSSEVLESFGGMGFIESSMLPNLLRDTQVLSIWEGTTNVLCYDFVRALLKKKNEFAPIDSLNNFFTTKQTDIENGRIVKLTKAIIENYVSLFKDINEAHKTKFQNHLSELRAFCFGLTRLYISVELLAFALSTLREKDISVVERWVSFGIYIKEGFSQHNDKQLGMDLDDRGVCSSQGDFDSRGKPRARL